MLKRICMIAAFAFALLIMFACGSPPSIAKANCSQVEIVQPPGIDAVNLEFVNATHADAYNSSMVINPIQEANIVKVEKAQFSIVRSNLNASHEIACSHNYFAAEKNIILSKARNRTGSLDTGPPTSFYNRKFLIQCLYAVRNHQNQTTL